MWQTLFLVAGFYFFGTLGELFLSGFIRKDNHALDGTAFASAGYWPLSFDTGPSSMVTLFALLIRNNWNMIVQGYVAATQNMWTWCIFIMFYVCLDLVMFNLLLA